MSKFFVILCFMLTLLTINVCFPSSPEAWQQHNKEVISTCLKLSGLHNARPVGEIAGFDDSIGYDVLLIRGNYPQPYMKNAKATYYCLFNRRTRKASVTETSGIDLK